MKHSKKIILAFLLSASELSFAVSRHSSFDSNTAIRRFELSSHPNIDEEPAQKATLPKNIIKLKEIFKDNHKLKPIFDLSYSNRIIDDYFKKYERDVVKNYSFSNCADTSYGEREAIVLTMKEGHKVVYPKDLDQNKQKLDADYVNECFLKLPKKLREGVEVIQIVDYPCSLNSVWEEKFKDKDFEAFATAGESAIILYKFQNANKEFVQNYLKYHVLAHESAHIFDRKLSNISKQTVWKEAVTKDINIGCPEGVSEYSRSTKSSTEDFADSVNEYIHHRADLKRQFPNRYKLINKLLTENNNRKYTNNNQSRVMLKTPQKAEYSMDINQLSNMF